MILKAFQNDIIICGIVTDNLPVQILAVSHESDKSFQNVFSDVKKIIHLRCCNHLLNLAFRDWTKLKNDLTIYEEKIHNIISVFKKKNFAKFLKHKIPSICQTRWYSPFNVLEMLIQNISEFMKLFKNPKKNQYKQLYSTKDDFLYLLKIGFPKVYPLLIPFLNLTFHLQKHSVSCIEAVIIIEYYLNQMKENIIKYEIPKEGTVLVNNIEKRLLLNKNIQIYQLASLLTPDGIVRYRKILGNEYDIHEDENSYWHLKIEIFDRKYTTFQMTNLNFNYYINDLINFDEKYENIFTQKRIKRKEKKDKKLKKIQKRKHINYHY